MNSTGNEHHNCTNVTTKINNRMFISHGTLLPSKCISYKSGGKPPDLRQDGHLY